MVLSLFVSCEPHVDMRRNLVVCHSGVVRPVETTPTTGLEKIKCLFGFVGEMLNDPALP
jgi:hypothetical protein